MNFSTDDLWNEFNTCKELITQPTLHQIQDQQNPRQQISTVCKNCDSLNYKYVSNEIICGDCGVIISEFICENAIANYQMSKTETYKTSTSSKVSTKINKMQNWYMFTNEEKNNYKLLMYTRELCTRLSINETIIQSICETVVNVMTIIKKYDGTKRARVKDGIILCCITYVYKTSGLSYNNVGTLQLAKKIDLDTKYVTKAEKLILEMINNNRLNLDKNVILDIKTPFHYVQEVIQKNNLKMNPLILQQVQLLIDICEEHDLLLDHTPLSVGVCCFYYVLKLSEIDIDLKLFSDLYDLSVVTVVKTYNKLRQQEETLKLHQFQFHN